MAKLKSVENAKKVNSKAVGKAGNKNASVEKKIASRSKTITKAKNKDVSVAKKNNRAKLIINEKSNVGAVKNLKNTGSPIKHEIIKQELNVQSVEDAASASVNNYKKSNKVDGPEQIFLTVTFINKKNHEARIERFDLPYPTFSAQSRVCLIVSDVGSEGKKMAPKERVKEVSEILSSQNVKSVKEVITLQQLRHKFFEVDAKKELCSSFDFFVAEHKKPIINHKLFKLLGKAFVKSKKVPSLIHIDDHIQENIESALSKVPMKISHSVASCPIGKTNQLTKHVVENVVSVDSRLGELFPYLGRELTINTGQGPKFPISHFRIPPMEVDTPVQIEKTNDSDDDEEEQTPKKVNKKKGRIEKKKTLAVSNKARGAEGAIIQGNDVKKIKGDKVKKNLKKEKNLEKPGKKGSFNVKKTIKAK